MTIVQLKGRVASVAIVALMLLFNCTMAFAQKVSGTVIDNFGDPLAGVNIVEKGTTHGTLTDVDGNYSIEVKQGKTLVFSFVGYTSQEVVVNGAKLNVTLNEDTELLEDVVVVGYGSMQRKDLTSSITTIKADNLNQGVFTSPAELLQGKVPGLVITNTSDPSSSGSISLRGASSLREGTAMEPYYVIDGVPGVDISMVSPDDIESIDVLRDATATAIYGSKAANGVIIVTTKRGKKGEAKTNVTYSGYVAWDKAMKTLDMMNSQQLLDFANKAGYDLSSYYDPNNIADTDWQDEVLRTGLSHNHSLNINGGNKQTMYNVSASYMNKEGAVKGGGMNKLNLRSSLQTTVLDGHLDLAANINANVTNFKASVRASGGSSVQGKSVLDAMYYYSPLVPVKNEDGSWYSNSSISQNYNPVAMINEDGYNTERKMLQAVFKATAHIIEGLDWNATYSYQNRQWIYNNYNSIDSQIEPSRHGVASRSTAGDKVQNFETYVNYETTFADKHKLSLMGGYSWEENNTGDGFGLTAYNFYTDDTKYYNMGMANSMDMSGISSYCLSTLRMISFYGRANYSFNSRYMLQATVRRDGSSAFGKNNRWATFPSASLAWNITEEDFMKNQNILDNLKFRIGYGVSGNSLGFDAFSALATYGWNGGWFSYTNAANETSDYKQLAATKNANPDLKWESTSMFNVGLDYGFLQGRISGTVEFYNKQTDDLIYNYPVSTNRYPYGYMMANVGEISNKGVEFSINAIPVQTKDFSWNTTINISHNKNVVEKLSNSTYSVDYIDTANPDLGGFNVCVQRIMEGESLGTFYTYEWAGYENGISVFNDYDDDGNLIGTTSNPNDGDRRKTGCAQPKVTYSWNNNFNYKNWSLTAFFQGVAGNDIFNAKEAYYSSVTNIKNGKNGLASIATKQLITDSNAQAPSDRYIESGSYLRLSSLTLGYSFGKLGKWLNNVKVYGTINNVFTITGYDGLDPEINLGGLNPGVDWRQSTYPRTRTYMLGVNVNF